MNARDKRAEKAQLSVLLIDSKTGVPFFVPAVAKLPVVFDETIPTACTDGKQIRFGTKFFDECSDAELRTVLCHEVAHCLFGHLWRIPVGADWQIWNMATDHAVNNMLKEFSAKAVALGFADPFPFPKGDFCCDPQFSNMAEEEIYAKLYKQRPPGNGGKDGLNGAIGSIEAPADLDDPQAVKQAKASWEQTLMQSATMLKSRGELPGTVSRLINEILNPTLPWYELVRQWLREQCDDDYNWLKPNPYFDESGFILPSLDSERMGAIVFATDTSGSIDNEMLAHFQAEKQNCLDDLKPDKLLDFCCDTRITSEIEYRPGETISNKAPGGGGTNFEPVFERINELGEVPKCLVYLTDLDGSFPAEVPAYPVLWIVYGGSTQAPFGEVIQAK